MKQIVLLVVIGMAMMALTALIGHEGQRDVQGSIGQVLNGGEAR